MGIFWSFRKVLYCPNLLQPAVICYQYPYSLILSYSLLSTTFLNTCTHWPPPAFLHQLIMFVCYCFATLLYMILVFFLFILSLSLLFFPLILQFIPFIAPTLLSSSSTKEAGVCSFQAWSAWIFDLAVEELHLDAFPDNNPSMGTL